MSDIPVTVHREGEEPFETSIRQLIVGLKPYIFIEFDPVGEEGEEALGIDLQFGAGVGPEDLGPLLMVVLESVPTIVPEIMGEGSSDDEAQGD